MSRRRTGEDKNKRRRDERVSKGGWRDKKIFETYCQWLIFGWENKWKS